MADTNPNLTLTVDPATLVHKQYIDKAYMIALWNRIKAIPDNTNFTIVDAEGTIWTPAQVTTIKGHLQALYELIKGIEDENKEHTTLSTPIAKLGNENISIIDLNPETVDGKLTYTLKLSQSFTDIIDDITTFYNGLVKHDDVVVTDSPVDDFESSGSLKVGDKTISVSIPANPAAALLGGEHTDKGIKVKTNQSDKKVGEPLVTVTPGNVAKDVESVTTGGKVFDAIKSNLTDEGQKVHKTVEFGVGTLLPGSITITTSNVPANEVADVTFSPVVTTKYGTKTLTNTILATDGYVEDKLAGLNSEYGLEGNDSTGDKVELKSGANNIYSGTLTLTEKIDGTPSTTPKTVSISIDATQFVADAFLSDCQIVTIEGVKNLRLIVTLADGTTKNIDVPMDQFDDPLKESDSVKISDENNLVNVETSGYVITDAEGNLTLDSENQFAKAESTTGLENPTNLASKKYVDSKKNLNSTEVSLSSTTTGVVNVDGTTATINKFGQDATISVKENAEADAKDFKVAVPELKTTDALTSKNVVTTIDAEGKISVTTNEESVQGGTAALAQAGYVDERVASITYTDDDETTLIDSNNKLNLFVEDEYFEVGTNGLDIKSGKLATDPQSTSENPTNLVTLSEVNSVLSANGISLTSSKNTLQITPNTSTPTSRGKSFKVEMLHETWSATDFPY